MTDSVYWALHVFAFSNCFHHTFIVEKNIKWDEEGLEQHQEEEEDNDDKGSKKDEEEDDDDGKGKGGKEKKSKEDSSLSRSTKVLIGKSQQTHPHRVKPSNSHSLVNIKQPQETMLKTKRVYY